LPDPLAGVQAKNQGATKVKGLTYSPISKSDKDIICVIAVIVLTFSGLYGLAFSFNILTLSFVGLVVMLWWSLQETPDDSLETADDAYYNEGEPIMSDEDYDAMRRETESEKVGAPVIGGTTHATPMLSLRNAIDEDELRDFFDNVNATIGMAEFLIEPKIDGLALNVTYSGGVLVSAVTRGDGIVGKDVTENMRHVLPSKIKMDTAEIRGEVYLSKANFAAINKGRVAMGNKQFKTCQSAVTATLMKENAAICKARKLKFVAYDMGYGKYETTKTQSSLTHWLNYNGFSILPNSKVRTFDGMLRATKRMFSECKLPCDGAVIKLDDFDGQAVFGVTKQVPNHAMGWKGMNIL